MFFHDFNLPNLIWIEDEIDNPNILYPINVISEKELLVSNSYHELGLNQKNKFINDNGNTLDLIWTNNVDSLNCKICDEYIVKHETHHIPLEIIIYENLNYNISNIDDTFFYDFKNSNNELLNELINDVKWDELLEDTSLELFITEFYSQLNEIIVQNVNLKKRIVSSHPKWFDKKLINMKNKLNSMRKKRYKSQLKENNFKSYRTEYNRYVRRAYNNYKIEMGQILNEDPSNFFDHVRYMNKSSNDLPLEMFYNDIKSNNRTEIANLFANNFSLAYTKHNLDTNNVLMSDNLRNVCVNVSNIEINEDIVLQQINDLPNNMIGGPDGIPNLFIKNCARSLIVPITLMLKKSLDSSYIPELWKTSFISPIYKSCIRNNIENYRGVALQNVIPKLLDSIISKHLNFNIKNIIDCSQHGFIKGRSTITNLVEFTSQTIHDMKPNNQTDAILYISI